MPKFIKLIGLIIFVELVGIIGSYFTFSAIPSWYVTLNKPPFSPPNYLFAPVWTTLYALMAISLFRVMELPKKKKGRGSAIATFWMQLGLNFIWTPVFFGAKNLFGGLIVIIILWFLIVKTIREFSKLDRISSYLLYPYLAWVSFASILNYSLWLLNK